MNNNRPVSGVLAAALTPLKADLSIDHDLFYDHCRMLLDSGCDGLVLFGTTGEANSFSVIERKAALANVLKKGLPPFRLFAGTGTTSVTDTIDLSAHALSLGVNNLLVLPPFYYKTVTMEALFNYFSKFIEALHSSDLRLYLYHIPQVSGVAIPHDLIDLRYEKFGKTIAGVKDSSGNWENMKALTLRFPNLRIFPGSELYLYKMSQMDGPGCISASTNVTYRLAAHVWSHRNDEKAEMYQKKLSEYRRMMETLPMIALLKYMRYKLSGENNWLNIRPPLEMLSKAQKEAADEILKRIKTDL